jgi:hypothetical protein
LGAQVEQDVGHEVTAVVVDGPVAYPACMGFLTARQPWSSFRSGIFGT